MHPTGDTFPRSAWREVPPVVAQLLKPRIEDIASEMVHAIQQDVLVYRRPLDSPVGRDLVTSVHHAVQQFIELTEDPDGPQGHHEHHFRRLGRIEFLNGRSTDGLQAAYRVGARVASRRYVEVAQAASLPTDVVLSLNEAVLAQINALSEQSVKGYAAAKARAEGHVQRSRRALAARILEQAPTPAGESLATLAGRAKWALPATVACLVLRPADGAGHAVAGLEDDILVLPRGGEVHLVVPEPENGARAARLRRAVRGHLGALGPAVPVDDGWLSLYCARLALNHVRPSAASARQLVIATDHLLEVHLLNGAHIGALMAERVLDTLRDLPDGKAARLAETLDALLMSWGRTAPEVADALGIHPQTARARLRRLEELFGERLSDPSFRFEALLALRTRALRRDAPPAVGHAR
ncbi:helix-turn-helix domain-containing protein [Streptomyces sp. NPDC002004]